MRIIVIGAGKAGLYLARKLSEEGHDLVLVDTRAEALLDAEEHMDVSTCRGSGADPGLLEEVGVSRAGLLVAITNSDETNIFACQYAKAAGVPHCVASIYNPNFLEGKSRLDLKTLGVDMAVNKSDAIARELYNLIRHPGAVEIIDLMDERVQVVGVLIDTSSTLLGMNVQQIATAHAETVFRIIGIKRGEELIIPRADAQILIGDTLYFVFHTDDVDEFLEQASHEPPLVRKVVIVGAGDTGIILARSLASLPCEVILMENDAETASRCAEDLENGMVIHGDALNEGVLEDVGMEGAAFVATLGRDEINMISCMLANNLGAFLKFAAISKPHYVSIINEQYIMDRAVSPYTAMSNAILHFIRGKNIRSATVLHNMPGELVEFVMTEKHKWSQRELADLTMPEGVIVTSVERGGDVIIPTGTTTMIPGDRIILFARTSALSKLQKMFKV